MAAGSGVCRVLAVLGFWPGGAHCYRPQHEYDPFTDVRVSSVFAAPRAHNFSLAIMCSSLYYTPPQSFRLHGAAFARPLETTQASDIGIHPCQKLSSSITFFGHTARLHAVFVKTGGNSEAVQATVDMFKADTR
jgi:hypothetical protein